MANTLTDLIPDLFEALDIVSREMTGFIPAASRDSGAERAAKGEVVRVPITTEESASDITPGPTVPDEGDTTVNNANITITNSRDVAVRFNGEETLGLENAGTYDSIEQARFAQAMRTLVNEVESDCAAEYVNASRAYGGAGTTPFGTKDDFTDFAGVARILDDNGAPSSNRQLVLGSNAWFNLRGTQTGVLQRANEAGSAAALREGDFGDVHGMILRNSKQVASHTAGSGTGLQTAESVELDETDIDLDTGSNDVLQGDVVSASSDDNKYVVQSGLTGGSGTITINNPGAVETVADNTSVSLSSDYEANMAFHSNALQLVTRAPAMPEGGDAADDRMTVQDDRTGIAFDVAIYRGFHEVQFRIGLAWGVDAIKPEHMALLLG